MSIITIKSENKDLSWVIYKNRQTQLNLNKPFEHDVGNGVVQSWFLSEQSFRLYFKSKAKDAFYKNLDNNNLNYGNYSSAVMYLKVINEVLSATIKKLHEKDIDVLNTIEFSALNVTSSRMDKVMSNHFENLGIDVDRELTDSKVQRVRISGVCSLSKLLSAACIYLFVQAFDDKRCFMDVSESLLKKYAGYMNNIQAGYFLRYLFLSRCVLYRDVFEKVAPVFSLPGWNMYFGNTQTQRFSFIEKEIRSNYEVLHDVGCGEMFYSKNLDSKFSRIYAWEGDDGINEANKKWIDKNNSNIALMGEFNLEKIDFIKKDEGCFILITEVLEHNTRDNAIEFCKAIAQLNFGKLVITVPNRDFNTYYDLGEMRHSDHIWEPNYEEFDRDFAAIFRMSCPNKKVTLKHVGDFDGEKSVSIMLVVE